MNFISCKIISSKLKFINEFTYLLFYIFVCKYSLNNYYMDIINFLNINKITNRGDICINETVHGI